MDQSIQLHGYLALINVVANFTELIGIICGLYLVCHAAFFEKFTLPIIDWRLNRIQQVLVGLSLIAVGNATPFLINLLPTGPEFDFRNDYYENKNQSPTPGFLKGKTINTESYLRAVADKCLNCYFQIFGYEIYPVSESFVLDDWGKVSQITILRHPQNYRTKKTSAAADKALILAVQNAAPFTKPAVPLHTPIKLLLKIDGTNLDKPLRAAVNIAAQSVKQTIMDKTTIQEKEDLFALITNLEKRLPFKAQVIAKLIGRSFVIAPEYKPPNDPNAHLHTVEDKTKFLTQVWIREPAEVTERDKGSVILNINPNMHCITQGEITKRFGEESSIYKQPINEVPADQLAMTYNYERSWGTLSFQVLQKEPHYLLYIVFETYQPSLYGDVLEEKLWKFK